MKVVVTLLILLVVSGCQTMPATTGAVPLQTTAPATATVSHLAGLAAETTSPTANVEAVKVQPQVDNETLASGAVQPTVAPTTADVSQSCPVTLPTPQPFVPPSPYPAEPAGDYFWYGDESLWTVLPSDGVWAELPHNPTGYTQKLVWWRVGYHWLDEPQPDLQIFAHRLDDPDVSFEQLDATNAYTPEYQSAMMIGVDFPTPGCWQITGRYRKSELSYVVQVEP